MEVSAKTGNRSTVAEKHTPWYLYNFAKSYLYLLSTGQLADPAIEVISLNRGTMLAGQPSHGSMSGR